jgi:hypothetical protein
MAMGLPMMEKSLVIGSFGQTLRSVIPSEAE